MGRILAIANQKGGVGKTTTAVNLAACMAAAGKSTLLIDLDPQGNATQRIAVDKNAIQGSTYDVLVNDMTLAQAVMPTEFPNLSLVPANRDLVGAEVELIDQERHEFRL